MIATIRCAILAAYRGKVLNATYIGKQSTRFESSSQNEENKEEPSERPIYGKNFKLDRSKVPTLLEKDLEEHFISGWGPGGQNVNKSVNACYLKHLPTGLSVKVHQTRSLISNRKIARELLVEKLDNLYNGENSVASQKKRRADYYLSTRQAQQERLRSLKDKYKNRIATETNGSEKDEPQQM